MTPYQEIYIGKDRQKYDVVSTFAYLIGVKKNIFNKENGTLQPERYAQLEKDKAARIIRNLCAMRTALIVGYRTIYDKMKFDKAPTSMIAEFPTEAMTALSSDGISLFNHKYQVMDYIIAVNQHISARIDNCRSCFPDWVEWKYIKKLFLMPTNNSFEQNSPELAKYYESRTMYPFQVYMNWTPREEGNILQSDNKFLAIVYQENDDEFTDLSKVSDVSEKTRENIDRFLKQAGKIVFVVDCENADPYKFIASINGMSKEQLSRISKIILCDDVNASAAWKIMENHVSVPVEYILTERVLERKSLLDVRVTAETCKEHYKNNVDSFVLVSSDSDYFGLIDALTEAKFLIMLERNQTSGEFIKRISENNICYCYTDDFYTGDDNTLKQTVVLKEVKTLVNDSCFNINDILEGAIYKARAEFSDAEYDSFYRKYIKPMHLSVAANGDVSFVFGKA